MPRGRPRKIPGEASFSSSSSSTVPSPMVPMAGMLHEPQDNALASSSGRPARNRIAVRRFGAASEQEYQDLPEGPSVSSAPGKQMQATPGEPASGYVMIHKNFMNDVCSKLGCSSCGKRSVQMRTEKLSGLASKLIMYCTACGVVLSQVTSSPEGDSEEETDFDVNRRFVTFFVKEGKTYDDVVVFSKTLGIPVISKSMFEKYRDELQAAGN